MSQNEAQNEVQNEARSEATAMKGSRPCFALMGEFSAGKTTLINFLLGQEILPTQVTATHVPPVWISHGDGDPYYIDSGNERHDADIGDIQSLEVGNVRYVRVFSEAGILRGMDMIDTPGISDPGIPKFHRETATDHADAVIWCTHATQAWRESERSAWMTTPEALRRRSILLATRSDKLDERSRERVRKRLLREAGDLFGSIIMFSATDALMAVQREDGAELLASSGGKELRQILQDTAVAIRGADGKAGSDVASTGQVAETGDVSVIRPNRVQRAGQPDRGRVAAEEPETVRDRPLDVGRPEGAEGASANLLHDHPQEPEGMSAPEIPDEPGDPPDDDLPAIAPLVPAMGADTFHAIDEAGESDRGDGVVSDLPDCIADEDDTSEEADFAGMEPVEMEPVADDDDEDEDGNEDEDGDEDTLRSVEEMLRIAPPARDDGAEPDGAEPDGAASDAAARARGTEPVSAHALWSRTLAECEVETVSDVLRAVGRFIEALEAHGMFAAPSRDMTGDAPAPSERNENPGWRMMG